MKTSLLIQITGKNLSQHLVDHIKQLAISSPDIEVDVVFYNKSQQINIGGSLKYKTHRIKITQALDYIYELIRNAS